ncbi:MAG: hypothetical protein A2X86_15135 [Bdellovibrionales bacterium GWA2_49_15]|nr:MAG: hypothetical protein A2X86_15135 [Bdellovibrionales bacterium GWA2_49_15]HAZ13321.1 hypothetical protein [Bdellovibrionales bacterium]
MKKKFQRFYEYKCTITEEVFQTTRSAPTPSELMSVRAYYQLHSDHDDRPEAIKKQLLHEEVQAPPAAVKSDETV